MKLTKTTTYKAEKITCKDLCTCMEKHKHLDFYDPADDKICVISRNGVSSVEWLYSQKGNKIVYLLSDGEDKITMERET